MAENVLGIDLGSTSVKAAVLAEGGACLSRFAEGYATARPAAGVAEQDPDDWMRLIRAALAQFAGEGLAGRIAVGCLTSQVNTHVFVDRAGKALMPAILWQDTRAKDEAAELDARLSIEQKIALLGAPIPVDASHPLARMLWVARHAPEVWAQTAHVLLPKDYCLFHLTGVLVSDPVSNFPVVGPAMGYVAQMLDLVPGAAARMAPLAGVTDVIGQLRAEAGLGAVPMIAGTMDGFVGLFGGGTCREGAVAYMSGTSEILGIAAERVNAVPGVVVFPKVQGLRVHAGPTQSGGASLAWFSAIAGQPLDQVAAVLDATPRRSPTPMFLPQLAGERAPVWDASLRGAFFGLDAGMGMADLARAVVEGVAMSGRHLLGALEASTSVVSDTLLCGGGGFRFHAGGQIRADVLGRRLERLAVNDPAVVGAAALAAFGAGGQGSLAEAHARFARYDRVWEPDAQKRGLFDDLFGLYLEAMQSQAEIGRRLSRL